VVIGATVGLLFCALMAWAYRAAPVGLISLSVENLDSESLLLRITVAAGGVDCGPVFWVLVTASRASLNSHFSSCGIDAGAAPGGRAEAPVRACGGDEDGVTLTVT